MRGIIQHNEKCLTRVTLKSCYKTNYVTFVDISINVLVQEYCQLGQCRINLFPKKV